MLQEYYVFEANPAIGNLSGEHLLEASLRDQKTGCEHVRHLFCFTVLPHSSRRLRTSVKLSVHHQMTIFMCQGKHLAFGSVPLVHEDAQTALVRKGRHTEDVAVIRELMTHNPDTLLIQKFKDVLDGISMSELKPVPLRISNLSRIPEGLATVGMSACVLRRVYEVVGDTQNLFQFMMGFAECLEPRAYRFWRRGVCGGAVLEEEAPPGVREEVGHRPAQQSSRTAKLRAVHICVAVFDRAKGRPRDPEPLREVCLATAETLRTIAADPQHLGAEIGFFAVLHTWGSNLLQNPHS